MTSMLCLVELIGDFDISRNVEGLDRQELYHAMTRMPECIFNFDDQEVEIWNSHMWPEEYVIKCALQFVEEHDGWAAFCREAVAEGWTD